MIDEVQRVAIAVVEHDGRYLVGTRLAGQPLAGHAEFPGGKCLPHETPSAAAVRECREETGREVVAVRRLSACRHCYEHGTLDLEFWLCRLVNPPADPGISRQASRGFAWLSAESLKSLNFPDANQPVLALLAAGLQSAG